MSPLLQSLAKRAGLECDESVQRLARLVANECLRTVNHRRYFGTSVVEGDLLIPGGMVREEPEEALEQFIKHAFPMPEISQVGGS